LYKWEEKKADFLTATRGRDDISFLQNNIDDDISLLITPQKSKKHYISVFRYNKDTLPRNDLDNFGSKKRKVRIILENHIKPHYLKN